MLVAIMKNLHLFTPQFFGVKKPWNTMHFHEMTFYIFNNTVFNKTDFNVLWTLNMSVWNPVDET